MRETKKKYGKKHPVKPLPEKVEKTSNLEKLAKRWEPSSYGTTPKNTQASPLQPLVTIGKKLNVPQKLTSATASTAIKDLIMKKKASLLKRAYGSEDDIAKNVDMTTTKGGPIVGGVAKAFPAEGRLKEYGKMGAQRKYMGQKAAKFKGIMGMSGGSLKPGLGQSLIKARPSFLKQIPREKQMEWAGSTKTGTAKDVIKFAACRSKLKNSNIKARHVREAADKAKKKAAFGSWYPPMHKTAATPLSGEQKEA